MEQPITRPQVIQTAEIDDCAREPIHIPGSVQPHGVLFILDSELRIVQVSENSEALLGRAAGTLIGTSVLDLVVNHAAPQVERLIQEAASTYVNPFRIPIDVRGSTIAFDGIAHVVKGHGTVLELELDPLSDSKGSSVEGLDNYLQIVQRSLSAISSVTSIERIADIMAREVKAFTDFDRVMVYRFAPDFHGHVIAEAKEEGMEPYFGLHYPASDIPAQARELYLKNQVRLLQDSNAVPVPLVPALHPISESPLDMSHCVLRAMSPIHVQYLKNMGVAASLSISLVVEGKLWGLIACHHRTPRFVSYAIRATVCLYAIVLSAQLNVKNRSLEAQRISSARQMALSILTGLRDFSEPTASLQSMLPRFLELFRAGGAALLTETHTFHSGRTPNEDTLISLRAELNGKAGEGVRITNRSSRDYHSLRGSESTAAGLVAIHLGAMEWLVMFRPEVSRQVNWAGNPNEAKGPSVNGVLTPRNSFALWMEEVEGECDAWPDETLALTTEVRSGILEILRKRNILLARSNQDLRRFASVVAHEVKNHLQTGLLALSLLEERVTFDDESSAQIVRLGRERLSDLGDFTNEMLAFSESDINTAFEQVELGGIVNEIIQELELSGLTDASTIIVGDLPTVFAPRSQMRHLMNNLVRNSLVHGRSGGRHLTIEVGSLERDGSSVVYVQDDGRGIPPDQQEKIFEYFYRGDPSGSPGSGIGLAFCSQLAQRLGQRLWVENRQLGSGCTFCFTVTKSAI